MVLIAFIGGIVAGQRAVCMIPESTVTRNMHHILSQVEAAELVAARDVSKRNTLSERSGWCLPASSQRFTCDG